MNSTPTPKKIDEITGTVERVVFQSPDNGFTVFIIKTRSIPSVTIKACIPNLQPGQSIQAFGSWVMHPKFGKQFDAQQCTLLLPTNTTGLIKYLSSGLIKGIGPVYAEKLVNCFGVKVLDIIDKQPEQLLQVPGIGQGRATKIMHAWKDQKEISAIMLFLQEKKISPTYALKIYKTYGNNAVSILHENPYRLADDIWGIGFKIADQIAHNLGISHENPARIRAGILFAISTHVSSGNLYIELSELRTLTKELLSLDDAAAEPLIKNGLHDLHDHSKIKLITYQEKHYLTLTPHYMAEKGVAQKLNDILDYPSPHSFDLDTIYKKLRTDTSKIALNDEQQDGIMACLQNKVTVITGGPGTGKTTLIKSLLTILDEQKVRYRLAAPTGRAAKRITEGTGRHACTIHRLLEYDPGSRAFVHNERNVLQLHVLIVDEASMIDIFLASSLLKASPLHAHIVFIGDIDQLPSVGAGNFLRDLIASSRAKNIRLKKVFRQAQDSLIIVNAHRVNTGEFPVSDLAESKKDFIFIKENDPALVQEHIRTVLKSILPRHGISVDDTIVLVPMNRGAVGTQKLNYDMQVLLHKNNDSAQIKHNGSTFNVGDRVMHIRNNYDKHVYNGDIGVIEQINHTDQQLIIMYQERAVEYDFSELDELVLAYAITIHKSQGSEYPAIIIPLFMQHFTLLQRNLLYTAITRAKKLCIVIGQPKAIALAIRNVKGTERTTFLQQFLTTPLQCR